MRRASLGLVLALGLLTGAGFAAAETEEEAAARIKAGDVGHGEAGAAAHGEGGEGVHEEAGHGPPPINLTKWGKKTAAGDQPPLLFALINFAVLLGVLSVILVPKLRTMVRERSARISNDLDEAAKVKAEAEAKMKEYSDKLARLEQDIGALTAEIRAEAEAEKRRLITAAEASATRAMQDAKKAIEGEMSRVRAHLEREAVEAAITAATKLISSKINEQDQRALADRFIIELGKAPRQDGGRA